MNRSAIYPGTFDPVTYGHLDIIDRASKLYDRVFVGVAHSKDKKPLFGVKERMAMLEKATSAMGNVQVEDFKGLVVEYAKKRKTRVILRGLRMLSDFEYEFQMALTNRNLEEDIETIFMMTHENFAYLSSKLIKEAVSMGADISRFVPPFVAKKLKEKFKN